jgi:hypothetical protein
MIKIHFNTEEEAFDYFIKREGSESDDVDKEEARFTEWFNDNDITIGDVPPTKMENNKELEDTDLIPLGSNSEDTFEYWIG